MKHLLKKLSFSGGKGNKPKPKPAQLKPPVLGTIQLAASFSYAELLDLVSDGPIAGLVNENGLILSSRDILQGIYLDNTAVTVSNDEAVEESPRYEIAPTTDISSTALVKTFRQVFTNMNETYIPYAGQVFPNYKVIWDFFYDGYTTRGQYSDSYYQGYGRDRDSAFTNKTDLTRIGRRWFFGGKNDHFNHFSNTKWWRDNFPPKNEEEYTQALIIKQLTGLFEIYDDKKTNKYEKTYLTNMFNANLPYNWQNLNRTTMISEFAKKIWSYWSSNSVMNYIIKVDPNDNGTYFKVGSSTININKKYNFAILDSDGNQLDMYLSYTNDLLLPRMDANGKTTGKARGIFCISMLANHFVEDNYTEGHAVYAIQQSNINSIINAHRLELKETVKIVESKTVRKYNYSNILAEYRSGEEYQTPFRYFNSVLIDKDYGSSLIGPFRMSSSVQRLVEGKNMINRGGALTTTDIDKEGSNDDQRLSKLNYSSWDQNIDQYNEKAQSVTHIINNPNVPSVFITIQVTTLSDTLSGHVTDDLSVGMNFASILNIEVETGSIDQKGQEGNKLVRRFKILALIQSPTFIDIGNPDLDDYNSDDYKFISEYNAKNDSSIFRPFVLEPISSTVVKRYVKVTKISAETNSSLLQKECSLAKVTEIIPQNFSYPHSAIIATKIDSRSFSSLPARTFDCKLKKVRVPSNYTPTFLNGKDKRYYSSELDFNKTNISDRIIYNGDWDGQFKKTSPSSNEYLLEWTDNPAWILLDLITNNRYGLGQYMDDSQIDIFDLYKIARFCDAVDDFGYFQGVPDGQGGLEPRFSCNIMFSDGIKVFDAINTIASLFRGIIYYNNSQINFVDDRPKDPIALFSNTNIKDGAFNYSNYRRDEQFNSIEVVYVDRFENFLTKIEYIEDEEDIRKRGIFKKTINANGVTSRAMARRLGKHLIFQTIKENQSVGFSAGLEALLCKPGDLIIIEDELKSLKSNFGKVLSINPQSKSIRLSDKFITGEFNNKLTVYTPTGYSTNDEILQILDSKRNRIKNSGFYLNSGNLPIANYPYLTGNYIFSKYTDGYTGKVSFPKQNEYAFYTGSNSKFCYFSTGFTGWVLGTGIPFVNNNLYSKIIFRTGDALFPQINSGTYNTYSAASANGRAGSSILSNKPNETTGAKSLFRDVSGSLETTNGLLDSEIILSSPSQITTFNISGIVQYDYGCEAFVHSSDINYSLVPFVKEGSVYRFQRVLADDQIYKVISIKEENVNEYSLVCTKFDTGKYNLIENDKTIEYQSNTYSYAVSQKIGDINYKILDTPNITQLITGLDASSQFYISGNWKQVKYNQGYNVNIKNSQGVVESKALTQNQTGAAFYVDGIGNYSFRVNAIGSVPNTKTNNANFYADSDYSQSGIFLIYEEGNLLNYDRAYLSSVTVL